MKKYDIDQYDRETAFHYAAYRPSLHGSILHKCLNANFRFQYGLDVGCGVGHSSIALKGFCNKVMGVDPSKNMLKKAISYDAVRYKLLEDNHLRFAQHTFDIVTFAGSLFYIKSKKLIQDVITALTSGGLVIVYDYKVEIDEILQNIMPDRVDHLDDDYNHEKDLSSFSLPDIRVINKAVERMSISIDEDQLLHLMLSDRSLRNYFKTKFKYQNVHGALLQLLERLKINSLDATTYTTTYRVGKYL